MKTVWPELLAEVDTLEDIKRVDANELAVVRRIDELEDMLGDAMFFLSSKQRQHLFNKWSNNKKCR